MERINDMISVKNLSHSYNKDGKLAVKDISFEVANGETFGFLGPSGAGKSTTQGILTGLLKLQDGEVTVAGYNIKKVHNERFNKIGVSFEQSNVYGKLTARENLEYYAKLFDVPTRDPMELIHLVGLDGKENVRAGEFSKGMKHRLTFARSMLNNPELWFLDEPTTGLDPAIAATIKDIIREKAAKGTTSFLTTHNMFIADELCDRVAFIIDGEIKLIDSPKNLKLQYGQKLIDIEYIADGKVVKETLKTVDELERKRIGEIVNNYEIQTMHSKEATLEEIFIQVTGRELVYNETTK
jgi:fluoroquinolone transport system ATP-binding protein